MIESVKCKSVEELKKLVANNDDLCKILFELLSSQDKNISTSELLSTRIKEKVQNFASKFNEIPNELIKNLFKRINSTWNSHNNKDKKDEKEKNISQDATGHSGIPGNKEHTSTDVSNVSGKNTSSIEDQSMSDEDETGHGDPNKSGEPSKEDGSDKNHDSDDIPWTKPLHGKNKTRQSKPDSTKLSSNTCNGKNLGETPVDLPTKEIKKLLNPHRLQIGSKINIVNDNQQPILQGHVNDIKAEFIHFLPYTGTEQDLVHNLPIKDIDKGDFKDCKLVCH